MLKHNTLYIAEPIFSEKLQSFGADISFPPIKKIGITTDHPERRERELLGTVSPVKVSIVKAWTNVDARKIESTLHSILDNTRLDGEYFWDGNETLVDAVSDFITNYHKDAQEIEITSDADVKAAERAATKTTTDRIYSQLIPSLENLKLKYSIVKKGKAVRVNLDKYYCVISARTGGRYTCTIFSKTQTPDQAISAFPGSQELSATASEESNRKARIPLASVDAIIDSLRSYSNQSIGGAPL